VNSVVKVLPRSHRDHMWGKGAGRARDSFANVPWEAGFHELREFAKKIVTV
jgi:hypothetical protein